MSSLRQAASGRRPAVLSVLALAGGILAVPGGAASAAAGPTANPPAVGPSLPVPGPRAVPAYANATSRDARVGAGTGPIDMTVALGNGGGQALWGDWDGDGTFTPATFRDGHWTLYATAVAPAGLAPRVLRDFWFGSPGDVAVVGDWNHNGRTDIGVYHRGWWVERDRADAGPTSRKFRFGGPTDLPLVGDWDGNGKDSPGLRRGNTFLITDVNAGSPPPAPEPPAPTTIKPGKPGTPAVVLPPVPRPTGPLAIPATAVRTLVLGRATDRPVAGDWDGDGQDGVGLVRNATWFLRNSVVAVPPPARPKPAPPAKPGQPAPPAKPVLPPTPLVVGKAPTLTLTVPRPANGVPVPFVTSAGPTGAACPTATTVAQWRGAAAAAYVVPPVGLNRPRPTTGAAPLVRETVLNSAKFQLGDRWQELYAARTTETYLDLVGDNRIAEYAIRGPANAAVSLAISARTGGYDPKWVGAPLDTAMAQAGWLVRSIACQHGSTTPGGWGYNWQTAHWANLTGEAAWLLWDQPTVMPDQVKAYVAGMVEAEADRLLTLGPQFWKDRTGAVAAGRDGNTASEEDAWNGAHLAFAAAMMPTHPHASLWHQQAVAFGVAAFATPSDVSSPGSVNGVSLAGLPGWNVNDDGTVVNHGSVDPDYMAAAQHMWWSAQFARLGGQATYPRAYVHHGDTIYGALTRRVFDPVTPTDDGFYWAQPGGTIYNDRPEIYFPAVQDWGTTRRASWVALDANALLLNLGGAGSVPADVSLVKHTQQALDLQRRHADGRSYQPVVAGVAPEDTYFGAEEYAAQELTFAWMALYLQANAPVSAHDDTVTTVPTVGARLRATVLPGTVSVPALKTGSGERLSP